MRLPRPHIPLEVRCRVVLRQLGEMFPESIITVTRELADPTVNPKYRRGFGRLLKEKLAALAELLGCEPSDLHLDHDPALAVRLKLVAPPDASPPQWAERDYWQVLVPKGWTVLQYVPDANDPEFLVYRVNTSHAIKTRVRGEHGQLSDLSLMKKLRKQDRKRAGAVKPKRAWAKGRKLRSRSAFPKGRKFNRKAARQFI